jgi:hypothetical protein
MLGIELEKPPDTIDELGDILVAEGIAERKHGNGMLHFCKAARRRGADLLRRRIRRDEVREFRLYLHQPLTQGIVGRVRDRRRILLIVTLVVPLDFERKPHQLDLGLGLGELVDVNRRLLCFHSHRYTPPLRRRSAQ